MAAVVAYRVCLSPWLGGRCRFVPSCSSYALLVLQRWGAWAGLRLVFWRLARCHPWHPGGFDPAPPTSQSQR